MRQLSVLPATVFFFQTNLPLRNLVQYISTRKTSCHPEILVEIAGPHLAVAGAAFGGTLTTQIPTDYVYLGPHPPREGRPGPEKGM